MPSACARASAAAICRVMWSARRDGEPAVGDDLAEARSLDELEHEEERAVLELAEVGRGRDVRMIDVRGRHRLALEARDDLASALISGWSTLIAMRLRMCVCSAA